MNFFLTTIRGYSGYPKVRDLKILLGPKLSLIKINAILRYLVKSNSLEIDLDGNIIWSRQENIDRQLSFGEAANISPEFLEYFSAKIREDTEVKDDY